ncbi:hypothetical protein TBS_12920 [Thermobispora bispora]|uniref:DUF3710 domain-containing protein n=1 Tax=Thermobispora bispora (strain ATCC 19993 / DSM 43833 / CBS 139.67 / JCM 10125 / KCTC 9307 / NBRC 14880 / R51) TaxID=469371 RepID=D6Y3C4_THEBD|nr:DUF3710 domain-containing protein [Thermobispora bispora]ADG88999.1 hypothetical protein Tbis_2289 [Thermobispora bispora DSM 43833]MDI9579807.1 DUF3710 domain-containing protein [Thermobispora sp.]
MLFRRRRRAKQEEAEATPVVTEEEPAPPARTSGPWDADDPYPQADRIDLGGLRVPVRPGFEIRVSVTGDQIDGALVLVKDSMLHLQAMAAPKRSGIWDEVRAEIAQEVEKAGGKTEEQEGPFGVELVAYMPQQEGEPQRVRYAGIDGPRWMLRAIITGRAAVDPEAAEVLESVVRDTVVVRGDEPMPPKEPILLRLPDQARQLIDQSGRQEDELRPFERGPEIAETR